MDTPSHAPWQSTQEAITGLGDIAIPNSQWQYNSAAPSPLPLVNVLDGSDAAYGYAEADAGIYQGQARGEGFVDDLVRAIGLGAPQVEKGKEAGVRDGRSAGDRGFGHADEDEDDEDEAEDEDFFADDDAGLQSSGCASSALAKDRNPPRQPDQSATQGGNHRADVALRPLTIPRNHARDATTDPTVDPVHRVPHPATGVATAFAAVTSNVPPQQAGWDSMAPSTSRACDIGALRTAFEPNVLGVHAVERDVSPHAARQGITQAAFIDISPSEDRLPKTVLAQATGPPVAVEDPRAQVGSTEATFDKQGAILDSVGNRGTDITDVLAPGLVAELEEGLSEWQQARGDVPMTDQEFWGLAQSAETQQAVAQMPIEQTATAESGALLLERPAGLLGTEQSALRQRLPSTHVVDSAPCRDSNARNTTRQPPDNHPKRGPLQVHGTVSDDEVDTTLVAFGLDDKVRPCDPNKRFSHVDTFPWPRSHYGMWKLHRQLVRNRASVYHKYHNFGSTERATDHVHSPHRSEYDTGGSTHTDSIGSGKKRMKQSKADGSKSKGPSGPAKPSEGRSKGRDWNWRPGQRLTPPRCGMTVPMRTRTPERAGRKRAETSAYEHGSGSARQGACTPCGT